MSVPHPHGRGEAGEEAETLELTTGRFYGRGGTATTSGGVMGECADTRLPVYRVATTGIQESEAQQLAEALRIPANGLRWLDGEASFVDRDKYLAVPSVPIEDPDIVARFTDATTNHHPEIPIAVTGIDYAALDRHVPFADDLALRSAAAALESAGLTPASARPMVGHTVFTTVAIGADGAEQEQRRTLLDTHVSYRFTIDGYPLVGPGAQIQISFGAEGNVTRLIHATRVLEPGPSVAIIDADAIRHRISCSVTDDVAVDVRLVYLAPSLRNALNGASYWRPSEIIPWYAVTVTRMVTHPDRGTEHPRTSRVRLIPATDDTRFVPVGDRRGECRRGLPRRGACNSVRRHGALLVPVGRIEP